MKKTISLFILLTMLQFGVFAQEISYGKECDFFGSLKFKNGMATTIIKATYCDIFRNDESPIFKKLEKRKKLYAKDYFSRCCSGTAMGFKPENCSYEYAATMRKKIKFDSNQIKPGQVFYLTCVVFDGINDNKSAPFFVIKNISLTN